MNALQAVLYSIIDPDFNHDLYEKHTKQNPHRKIVTSASLLKLNYVLREYVSNIKIYEILD